MTRYARAKGSKSSNERLPNEATPWHVMKEQLENATKNKNVSENTKSAKELLKEKEESAYNSTDRNSNNWAAFDEGKSVQEESVQNEKKKIKKNKEEKIKDDSNSEIKHNSTKTINAESTKRKISCIGENKSNKMFKQEQVKSENCINDKISPKVGNKEKMIENETNNETDSAKIPFTKLTKRQKRNLKHRKANLTSENNQNKDDRTNLNTTNANNEEGNSTVGPWQYNRTFPNNFMFNDKFKFKHMLPKRRKPPKVRDDKEHKRRKPDVPSTKVTINGVEIEIVKYDGFPVKKEDAERLKELRQKMVIKGIPKSEIDAAMKLERRKAEKALARIKKCVCFHCRKSGHNLSDCPELANEQLGTGICFKCGSTEHTHFECKVTKNPEYRYATCFICREQGHISKQCPDNPRGVYPEGGACKICGDVTHLKKDCPDLIKEKEESTVTIDKITDATIESLGNDAKEKKQQGDTNKVSKSKIVQF